MNHQSLNFNTVFQEWPRLSRRSGVGPERQHPDGRTLAFKHFIDILDMCPCIARCYQFLVLLQKFMHRVIVSSSGICFPRREDNGDGLALDCCSRVEVHRQMMIDEHTRPVRASTGTWWLSREQYVRVWVDRWAHFFTRVPCTPAQVRGDGWGYRTSCIGIRCRDIDHSVYICMQVKRTVQHHLEPFFCHTKPIIFNLIMYTYYIQRDIRYLTHLSSVYTWWTTSRG
jgi:hypothetical protein